MVAQRAVEFGVSAVGATMTAKRILGETLHREAVLHAARHNHVDDATAEIQTREAARYLYLLSAHHDQLSGLFLPVEQQIDEVWHYLILQTRQYQALCEDRLPGKVFLHHRSISYSDYGDKQASREEMLEEFLRWIPLYRTSFGDFDEVGARWWTMVKFLIEAMSMSIHDINALTSPAKP